ncbi:MAG TPA: hypothetical protein PKJ04_05035, partial [Nitrospira sp.]|nr:hypothetical protein [Nitrospira sp.]
DRQAVTLDDGESREIVPGFSVTRSGSSFHVVGDGLAATAAFGLGVIDLLLTPSATSWLSIYSAMDSTSLVYSDPMAASQANDNPYRWLGFILHPVGHVVDYTVNRPLYAIAKHAPYIFGYTPEDSMIDSQRR